MLSLVLALGVMGGSGRSVADPEQEPTVEISEDGELLAREGLESRVVRRHAALRCRSSSRALARPSVPRALEPTARAPSPPGWQRPRRVPPADDDGDDAPMA